jgi:hypothetical protein
MESNEKDTSESILNSIIPLDKELRRLLHEKQMLLSRLLNIPQETLISPTHSIKPTSSLEAITYAASYCKYSKKRQTNLSIIQLFYLDNELIQLLNQAQNNRSTTIDIQSISAVLIQLGEQLTSALVCKRKSSKQGGSRYWISMDPRQEPRQGRGRGVHFLHPSASVAPDPSCLIHND